MSRPPANLAADTRGYDRSFDWAYVEPEPPQPPGAGPLIPVIWDGLWLNVGDRDDGLCVVVTGVEGWLDSPPFNGNDVSRVISDGSAWGPKVLNSRTIVIHGAAAGPRALLGQFRDELTARAASREPAELLIGDYDLQRVLTADVRAGTDAYRHTALGRGGFRYQVTVTAADPLLYAAQWQTAILTNLGDELSGREYPREYGWAYGLPSLPNSALLANAGNHETPVYAVYRGYLSQSTLTATRNGIIRLAQLEDQMEILVNSGTLTAEAAAGMSRASYILPGSRPMLIPARTAQRWSLRAVGQGSVSLAWRSAWA